MSGVFRFKQFDVRNEAAAQKVGTDAVLLGAAMTLPNAANSQHSGAPGDLGAEPPQTANASHLLDIGTGTGVIALMVAQRMAAYPFKILAIDIDSAAASEAAQNFATSPWAAHLRAENLSLRQLDNSLQTAGLSPHPATPGENTATFDAIFSNPPFFEDSLKAPDARRSTARHTDTLSYREICAFAAAHLKPGGTLSLILPASEEQPLLRYAASFSLKAFRILRIRTTAKKPASRIIAEFRLPITAVNDNETSTTDDNSTIKTSSNNDNSTIKTSGNNDNGTVATGNNPQTTSGNNSTINPGHRPNIQKAVPVTEELILMSGTDRSPAYAALTKDFYL